MKQLLLMYVFSSLLPSLLHPLLPLFFFTSPIPFTPPPPPMLILSRKSRAMISSANTWGVFATRTPRHCATRMWPLCSSPRIRNSARKWVPRLRAYAWIRAPKETKHVLLIRLRGTLLPMYVHFPPLSTAPSLPKSARKWVPYWRACVNSSTEGNETRFINSVARHSPPMYVHFPSLRLKVLSSKFSIGLVSGLTKYVLLPPHIHFLYVPKFRQKMFKCRIRWNGLKPSWVALSLS